MTQAQLICRNFFLKCSLNTKKDFQIATTISILSDNVAQYYADNVEAIQEKRTEVNTLMRLAIWWKFAIENIYQKEFLVYMRGSHNSKVGIIAWCCLGQKQGILDLIFSYKPSIWHILLALCPILNDGWTFRIWIIHKRNTLIKPVYPWTTWFFVSSTVLQ